MSLLSKWLVSMVALYIAAWVVPGIRVEGNGWVIFSIVAVILSVLNATIRPILKFLSCGLILITLGLFIFIIDASVLMLASNIAINWFGIGFYVDSFSSALLGSLIVTISSLIMNQLIKEDRKKK